MSPRRYALWTIVVLGSAIMVVAGSHDFLRAESNVARYMDGRPSRPSDSVARSRELVRVFERITERDPFSFTAFRRLAEAELALARSTGDESLHDRAIRHLERSVELNSQQNTEARGVLAAALGTKHRFADSLRIAEDALSADPSAEGWLSLVAFDAAFGLGKYESAEKFLARAAKTTPGFATLTRQAHVAVLHGDPARAKSLLAEAMRRERFGEAEPLAWLHVQVGILDLDVERYDDARRHFAAALDVMLDFHVALEHLAETYEAEKRDAEARPLLLKAIAVKPAAAYRIRLAAIERRAGDPEAADRLEKTAISDLAAAAAADEAAHGREFATALLQVGGDDRLPDVLALLDRDGARRNDVEGDALRAEALRRAGRLAAAKTAIDRALRFGTKKPDWHVEAAEIADASGDRTLAEKHRATAAAMKRPR